MKLCRLAILDSSSALARLSYGTIRMPALIHPPAVIWRSGLEGSGRARRRLQKPTFPAGATNNLEGDEHENELHSAGGGFAGSGDPRIRVDEPDTSHSGANHAGSIHPDTCGEAYEGEDQGPQEDCKGQARKGEACGTR